MIKLCAPAIIYLIFSITQILIDTFKGLYNTALMKVIVATMVTILLNILCEKGLSTVSWIIVFIPFILMTVLVSMLLYLFGLDAATGSLNYKCDGENIRTDTLGNIIIYSPEYNPVKNPVIYEYPNIIVPNPHVNPPPPPPVTATATTTTTTTTPSNTSYTNTNYLSEISKTFYNPIPYGSSSPSYQS